MPHTIKEVCTTPVLYLTKTEREERRKIVLAFLSSTSFSEFVFLEIETENGGQAQGENNWLRGKEGENSQQRKGKNKRWREREEKRV